jgi:hypothetical protein
MDIKINRDLFPPSSCTDYLVLVDKIEGDRRKEKERLHDNSNRQFFIKALFSKELFFNKKVDLELDDNSGSSFFIVPPKTVKILIPTSLGVFTAYKNNENELSSITADIITNGWDESFKIFYKVVTPFLDHLSFIANIPLIISKIYCRDVKNNLSVYKYEVPYTPQKIDLQNESVPNTLIPIFALYREAKNNISSYYRFLCYYKILEGIFKYLRPQLFSYAKGKGITIQTKKEVISLNRFYEDEQKNFVGKNIRKVFDDYLTNQYRNVVSHYLSDDGTILNVSDHNLNIKFSKVLYFVEECVRVVLNNQLFYYKQIEKIR